jgi:hypothetical protein
MSWRNATDDERPRLVRDAAAWRAHAAASVERVAETLREAGFREAEVREATLAYREPSADERENPSVNGPSAFPEPEDPRPWPVSAAEKDPTAAMADPWLVEGVLRPARFMVWAAAEGVGKSYGRAELAIRLATGHGALFDHYPIPAPCRVLLIEVENGDDEEIRREEEILERLGLARADLGDYWTLSLEGLALGDGADQEYVREAIRRAEPAVVIFDTGSSMIGDEWGAELKAAVRFLRGLARAQGCAVVVCVHVVKPSRQGKRGKDTAPHGQELVDVMGQWTRQADSVGLMSETSGGRVLWTMRKRVPRSTLVLVPEAGTFHAIEVAAGEDLGAPTRERVYGCIATGQADALSIAGYLGLSLRTVRRHVAALREAGRVAGDGPLAVSPASIPMQETVSPGVTRLVTLPPSTNGGALSPGVTPTRDKPGDSDGDMSPAPIGEAGDSVTPSPPACFADPERFRTHHSDHYQRPDGWGCRSCEATA